MNEELQKLLLRPTASVPEVGRIAFDLSRGASYEAAKRGDIQVIEMGRKKRVSTAWLRKKLDLDPPAS